MTGKVKGTLYVLLCVALWAMIPVVARLGQASLDNHQFLFWSSLVSFLVLGLSVVISGRLSAFHDYTAKDWAYLITLGLLGTYVYYLFLYLGYAQAIGIEVLVVQYLWPILIVIFAFFILRERPGWKGIVAIMLGFGGVTLVLSKGEFQNIQITNLPVILLVGVGAACFALFSVLSKRVSKEPLGVVAVYFFAACLASLASMLVFSEFAYPTRAEIAPILLNGILVNGFSYVFWLLALRATPASYLAPFVFLTPILSALYLVLWFDAPILLAYLAGLAMVLAGGLLNSIGAGARARE